jgi:hypothetical protein
MHMAGFNAPDNATKAYNSPAGRGPGAHENIGKRSVCVYCVCLAMGMAICMTHAGVLKIRADCRCERGSYALMVLVRF